MDFLRIDVVSDVARTLLLAGGAFLLTLLGGGRLVRWLKANDIGKRVREEGPQSHQIKTGTPTMGGIMIVVSVVIMTLLFNLVGRYSMLLPLAVLVSYSILGGFDDFLTLTRITFEDVRLHGALQVRLAGRAGTAGIARTLSAQALWAAKRGSGADPVRRCLEHRLLVYSARNVHHRRDRQRGQLFRWAR